MYEEGREGITSSFKVEPQPQLVKFLELLPKKTAKIQE